MYDPQGRLIAKHRKVHLFDINIPGRQVFKVGTRLSHGGAADAAGVRFVVWGCDAEYVRHAVREDWTWDLLRFGMWVLSLISAKLTTSDSRRWPWSQLDRVGTEGADEPG